MANIVRRCCLLVFVISAPLLTAEEIQLKNGTKLTGTIVRVDGSVFQVKTAYGDVRIPRSDLISISFAGDQQPDNTAKTKEPPVVNERLAGTAYTNHTANFELGVPDGWLLAPELVRNNPTLLLLSNRPTKRNSW